MKRKILFISIGILSLIIMAFFAYSKVSKANSTQVKTSDELTSAQKEIDFRYLTNLTVEAWPFVDTNAKTNGLSDIPALSKKYIQKAGKTKNDTEFMKLINEYITCLSQTGHANLIYGDPIVNQLLAMTEKEKNIMKQTLSFYNIDQSVLNKVNYWYGVYGESLKTKFAQSEVKVMYTNGKYIVAEPCKLKLSGKVIQMGAEIETIDGYPVDEYVKALQIEIGLGYDNKLQKLFLFDPLMVKSQNSDSGWKVSFRLPNNDIEEAVVSESYQLNTNSAYKNLITEDLSENIGYIKIFSFPSRGTSASDTDKRLISDYIKKSQGKYKKLIIDIRGNGGGDPEYWRNLIVAPLIKKSVVSTQTAVTKKDFFKYWGKTVQQYIDTQYIDTQTQSFINKKNNAYLMEIMENKNLPGYDDSWVTFNVQHKISPEDTLPFDGKIYLLVDGGSFSASEDFAQFCKGTGFAEIVGTNTGGGAAALLSPHYFSLPESKIAFGLEVEAVLNTDGTMSELLGTEPDIEMGIKPTPTNYSKKSLLQDEWIRCVIND